MVTNHQEEGLTDTTNEDVHPKIRDMRKKSEVRCQRIMHRMNRSFKVDTVMKREESVGWEEQAHLKKNQVEMKDRDNLFKNSVAGSNSSFDTAQERVSELED